MTGEKQQPVKPDRKVGSPYPVGSMGYYSAPALDWFGILTDKLRRKFDAWRARRRS
jgi:hypothetical protein